MRKIFSNGMLRRVLPAAAMLFSALAMPASAEAAGLNREAAVPIDRFAFELYGAIAKDGGNICFSPFSVSTAFAMAYAGAAGETAAEFERVFGFNERTHAGNGAIINEIASLPDEAGRFVSANSIWPRNDFRLADEFKSTMLGSYGALVSPQDFADDAEGARRRINDWVSDHTEGKIGDIMPPDSVSASTAMVLVNAVYFNAPWAKKFDRGATDREIFHAASGDVEVDMMSQLDTMSYTSADKFDAVKLPYSYGAFSMTVVLPHEGVDLADVEGELSAELLADVDERARRERVSLRLPKFRIESSFGLADTISELGAKSAFSASAADFSRMNGERDLFISAAQHKAFIEVGEEGTEAAAATGIGINLTSVREPDPEKPKIFHADRPFFFVVRDELSGAVLFAGRFARP